MIFSYNWLQSFFKKPLPKPEKLAELLTLHSFEVKEVRREGKDWILDIDVLPNRGPDCFSHRGIAREIAAITDLRFKIQDSRLKEDKKLETKPRTRINSVRGRDFITVEVKDKDDCSRYTARVIVDVKVGPSPMWIQERLRTCGLRPINNIVDIANYVMLETGQPLHAFDFEKIKGKKIVVRRAKKGEKIITLDNEKYDLDEDILIIADLPAEASAKAGEKGPLAIAGIKGGKKAEIDKKTKIVVLESANFNQKIIRKGSKKLNPVRDYKSKEGGQRKHISNGVNLKTDASWRFEHGIDPNLTEIAINRAAELIQEIAKGKTASGLVDFYPKKALPKKIKLDLNYLERLLGVKISTKEVKNILERLDFKLKTQNFHPPKFCEAKLVAGKKLKTFTRPNFAGQNLWRARNSKLLEVEVSSFRLDISIPEDLIEEIGRIYGYQKIPATFPVVSLIPPKKNLEIFWEDFSKNILKEIGFTEVYNYSFIGEKEAEIFVCQDIVEVENPMSVEQKYLRPSLIPNLLKNVEKNFRQFEEIKIFELGKIFRKNFEKKMLSGLITGDAFYQLKGAIDSLLNKLGISDVWYDDYQQTPEESRIEIWNPKKSGEIKVGKEEIGFLGEISPKILKTLKIPGKVVLFDIDFEKLVKLCSEEHEYRPISQYPAAVRDLAVLVPLDVRVEEVLNKIEIVGGTLVRDVDLFDIYEGEELPEGKKNLAFHIIYQAEDRTLTSKEIDELQNKIINSLEENSEWEVRR